MSTEGFFESAEEQNITKTLIVTKYFNAWSKIMLSPKFSTSPSGKIAYVDLFSGPGKFNDGQASTPLEILNIAVNDKVLCSRLTTTFNDKDSEYASQLQKEIDALPGVEKLANKPRVSNVAVGSELVSMLGGSNLVPTLFFIDPWGYKGLSLELIGNAIRHWGCDCIFFFNYNRINPGVTNPSVTERMNDLFGVMRVDELREKVRHLFPQERQATIINELAEALREVGGKYVLPFEFKSRHGERTSHHVIFVSKHFLGYHIMKDVMSKLSSDDGEVRSLEYTPVKSPQLRLLFEFAKPHSISALKALLSRDCAGKTSKVWDVYANHSVDTPYTLKNFQDAIIALEAEGAVKVDRPADKRIRNGVVTLGRERVVTFPP
jgi:three-Cys-motif partner protein